MRPLEVWLQEYSLDHTNAANQKLHLVCVPLIFSTVMGLLHLLPWYGGDILMVLALLWYAFLGFKAFAIIVFQMGVAIGLCELLKFYFPATAVWILVGIFALAWVGQFYGHHLEGRRPSFFKDLQYLLIGPLWVWLGKH